MKTSILVILFIVMSNGQINDELFKDSPDEVYNIAKSKMYNLTYDSSAAVGKAMRCFWHIPCDSLIAMPQKLQYFIEKDISSGRSEWLVPIFADGILQGTIEIVRYAGENKFELAGYRYGTYLGLSIVEINNYWVKQKGYHPIIIHCGYNRMLHIPDLGPNNLTPIATSVLDRDHGPGIRKCRLQKLVDNNDARGNSPEKKKKRKELWKAYTMHQQGKDIKKGLAKTLKQQSDFVTVDSLEEGIEWLKNNPGGK